MRSLCAVACCIMLGNGVATGQFGDLAGDVVTLYPNQDFENEAQDWGFWPGESRTRLELDREVLQHGAQSLRFTAVDGGDRAFALAGWADYEPGVMYRVTVHVRRDASVPASAVSFFINFAPARGEPIKSRQYPVAQTVEQVGEWERCSGIFIPDETAPVGNLLLGVEHVVGRVWFDNIIIENLGRPDELTPDVWTNLTAGVEIGSPPLQRFIRHRDGNTPVFRMASRFNDLLWRSAYLEHDLRDLERCAAYAAEALPDALREAFEAGEGLLNEAFTAFTAAFRDDAQELTPAFTGAADRLQAALDGLAQALEDQRRALASEAGTPLPPRLGPQNLGVEALTPEGRMRGFLFGAWSPLQFSELEQERFSFVFHSSAPGAPRVHTADEMDFSNITETCDRMEALGYQGTFGYLGFGIHQYMYAPQWLVDMHAEEPDFFKLSWDGLGGGSRGSSHSLNYFHPAVQEYIRDYLGRYAAFCRDEPRVLFHEVAQEADPGFTTDGGRRMASYGPHATEAFRAYLRGRWGDINTLNEAWGSDYADFDAIEPPPDPHVERWDPPTPLTAEFAAFDEQAYMDYLKLIYDSLKAADPDKPVVARHSALLRSINGARIFETCDILSGHNRAPLMNVFSVYLNSLNRYHNRGLGYMEDFWGVQEEAARAWDERAQRRGLEKHMMREGFWGRTLQMKWYAYTSGSYVFTYNGNWFNPRTDLTTWRYCVPALGRTMEWLKQVEWMVAHSEIAPAQVLVMQPSAAMRMEPPGRPPYGEIMGLHALLTQAGIPYELVPEEYVADSRCRLDDFGVVILPAAKYLAEDLQEKLAGFVTGGGTLVAVGRPGAFDELARPATALHDALRAAAPAADWDAPERAWDAEGPAAGPGFVTVACGEGQVVALRAVSSLAHAGQREAFADLLIRHAPRAAWAENARLEVVLRVAEDGERYLCLLNPDVDQPAQETVRVAGPVARAVDVLIPGGFPVPVAPAEGGVALDVRLGPGEATVIHLGP